MLFYYLLGGETKDPLCGSPCKRKLSFISSTFLYFFFKKCVLTSSYFCVRSPSCIDLKRAYHVCSIICVLFGLKCELPIGFMVDAITYTIILNSMELFDLKGEFFYNFARCNVKKVTNNILL